jgi:hypothetical protein
MIAPIQKVGAWLLRKILQNKLYSTVFAEASPLGGWFNFCQSLGALHRTKVSTGFPSCNVNTLVVI